MIASPDLAIDFRYERKFFIDDRSSHEVEMAVKLHPAAFSPVYYPRVVNNIYFDTPGLDNYFDNVNGEQHRFKARIRWYGSLFAEVQKPVLEFKIKNGLLGTKQSYPLRPFSFTQGFNRENINEALQEPYLPVIVRDYMRSLVPVIVNSYQRKYFLSFDKQYRVTIDTDLRFYSVNYISSLLLAHSFDRKGVVVELKYNAMADEEARDIASLFPFPLTKSSKYLQGIERICF